MNILFTNNRLDFRGGSETLLQGLGRSLTDLGHRTAVFSVQPGPDESWSQRRGVPVTTNLERLPFVPDIIHAQQHLDAMTALTGLPGVPAVFQCHGAAWPDCPPAHPRIYRYLAVSDTLAERIAVEYAFSRPVEVVLNSLDLSRLSAARTPPARPARALVFNYRHRRDSATIDAIAVAARHAGLVLDVLGREGLERIDRPEEVLPAYDVVFASGVSALEALACGCAVIILGRTSCGPLVRPENYRRLRRVNLTIAVNSHPPRPEAIVDELARYEPAACAEVTAAVRADADCRTAARALLGLYRSAIEEHRRHASDLTAELLATGAYLQSIAPLVRLADAEGRRPKPSAPATAAELVAETAEMDQMLDRFGV